MIYKVHSHQFSWETDNNRGIVIINTKNIREPYEEKSFTLKLRNRRALVFYLHVLSNDKYKNTLLFNDENNILTTSKVDNA